MPKMSLVIPKYMKTMCHTFVFNSILASIRDPSSCAASHMDTICHIMGLDFKNHLDTTPNFNMAAAGNLGFSKIPLWYQIKKHLDTTPEFQYGRRRPSWILEITQVFSWGLIFYSIIEFWVIKIIITAIYSDKK